MSSRAALICRRCKAWLLLSITIVVLAVAPTALAQLDSPRDPALDSQLGNQVDGYPVRLDGNVLFRIKQGIPGVVSAEERAAVINERLARIVDDPAISPDSIRAQEQDNLSVILAGETVLFTGGDSDWAGQQSRQAAAEKTVKILQSAVTQYRQDRSADKLVRGLIAAVLATVVLIGFLVLMQRLLSRLSIQLRASRRADRLNLRLQNYQILGSNATSYLLTIILKILRLALILGSFYLYIPFVLSQFPATRSIGDSVLSDIAYRVNQLLSGLVQNLPNFAMIAIIAGLAYYVIQFAKLVITELGRDDAYPWFYPEWVQPTNRIATILLVAIACIMAAPYLPGFNSPAFQGISLFLGALFTLGSSSAIANAIAGIILIYTRAFRIGDIIRIGDTTGEVIEKSLFVTRILTFKQETITTPNAAVLNSNVINFNAVSRESNRYLVLYTTITLGYDVSWRKIHEVLIEAAKATPGIVHEPAPFVLQTQLNDFNVSYELNAHSDSPQTMPVVYSNLHQNIQDYCNQAGIEILSPTYSSLRDGNHSTMPADYLPADYRPPRFEIHSRDQDHQS